MIASVNIYQGWRHVLFAVLGRRIAVNDGEACKGHAVLRDASNRLGHKLQITLC